jgi:hypothetical protein
MAATPNFASTPTVSGALLTTAITGTRAAPGSNTATVFSPSGSIGAEIERIVIQPVATTVSGSVLLWRYNTATSGYFLYNEVQLPIQTASTGQALPGQTLEAVDNPNLFPIALPAGWALVAGLSITQTGVIVQVEGGSY